MPSSSTPIGDTSAVHRAEGRLHGAVHGQRRCEADDSLLEDALEICQPVHDVQGNIPLQAIKLKDGFMELYKGKGAAGLTADKLKGAGIGWTDIFEEIPVSVQNSNLVCALMAQVHLSAHLFDFAHGPLQILYCIEWAHNVMGVHTAVAALSICKCSISGAFV